MIQVDKNYVIDIDKYNFTVKIDKHKEDKNGEPVFELVGYYNSFESAIVGVIKSMEKRKLSRGTHTLEEALQIVQKNNDQFTKLLKKVVKIHDAGGK